jgi:hypothetical protein
MTIRPYAKAKADGTFTVTSYYPDDGAPLGDYAVMVVVSGGRVNTDEDRETDTPAEKQTEKGKGKRLSPFPIKYQSPATSGLSFTVQNGPNQLNLALKSK